MGILGAIVVAESAAMMTLTETKSLKGRAVGTETIGDDPLRLDVLPIQQPPQQSQRRIRIASLLHDHVHNLAFVINRSPDPHALACNCRHDLIKMPAR